MNLDEEVYLAQDGAHDAKSREDRGRDNSITADANIKGAWWMWIVCQLRG